ncbi:MAG: nucleoside:proton symporter [Alphaproteobacteria bacterium]|nr:nucleoside:proton symporter [Alphaproteobacteria bacterium]
MWQGWLGVVFLLVLPWALSENRAAIPWRLVISGVVLQFALALLLLRVGPVATLLDSVNLVVLALQKSTLSGTAFVFGYLGGGAAPFETTFPENAFILAFQGLPLILLVSALSALLFYWRILPLVVRAFAWALRKTLGLGGAVGVAAAANIFIGMIEAPLLIRPYLRDMDRAGLFLVMTVGMATIAGNMFVLYATILTPVVADAAGNLLTASVISAPAAAAVSALLVPGRLTGEAAELADPANEANSSAEAVINGTIAGTKLVISVAATLIVAIALVGLINQLLALLPAVGGDTLSLQRILGWLLAPVVWLMGIPWSEAPLAGELMGTKIVLNELVAYLEMAALPSDSLSPQSRIILLYGLCGFANLGSLGILLGGLCAMLPERRSEIVALGPKSLLAGVLACFMTGAVAGLVA